MLKLMMFSTVLRLVGKSLTGTLSLTENL